LIFAHKHIFSSDVSMGIVDDRTSEYLEEIRRAMEASREEAGLPPSTTAAPSLEEIAAAVRESGLVGALNNIAATTISTSVSLYHFLFFWVSYVNVLIVSCYNRSLSSVCFFCVPYGSGTCFW
jgi:hypothetical protein